MRCSMRCRADRYRRCGKFGNGKFRGWAGATAAAVCEEGSMPKSRPGWKVQPALRRGARLYRGAARQLGAKMRFARCRLELAAREKGESAIPLARPAFDPADATATLLEALARSRSAPSISTCALTQLPRASPDKYAIAPSLAFSLRLPRRLRHQSDERPGVYS